MTNQTYTVKQVADILGYSTNSIYTFLKEKRIKSVRVGKGRFRIPQSELNRLLSVGKSKTTQELKTIVMSPGEVNIAPGENLINGSIKQIYQDHQVDVPPVFDWFISLSSIVLGLSMSLFTGLVEEFSFLPGSNWNLPFVTALCAGGLGLLVSDFNKKTSHMWRMVFRMILMGTYGALSVFYAFNGDHEGSAVYLVTAATLILNQFIKNKSIVYRLYTSILMLILPLTILFTGETRLEILGLFLKENFNQNLPLFWLITGVLILGFYLSLSKINKRFHWTSTSLVSGFLILISLIYARGMYWGRGFFFLLSAIVFMIIPFWEHLEFNFRRDRKLVISIFGMIGFMFVGAVFIIRITQNAIIDSISSTVSDKATYAVTTIENRSNASHSTIVNGSLNLELISSMSKPDKDRLTNILKALYESRGLLDRIAVFDTAGNLLAIYPLEELIDINISVMPWFSAPLTSGKSYISQPVSWPRDGSNTGFVISAPVINTKGVPLGVISGFLPISVYQSKIASLLNVKRQEYLSLVNGKSGKYLIYPPDAPFEVDPPGEDPAKLGSMGRKGVIASYDYKSRRVISGYSPVEFADLGLAISAPVVPAIEFSRTDIVVIFSLLVLSLIVIFISTLTQKHRTVVRSDTS